MNTHEQTGNNTQDGACGHCSHCHGHDEQAEKSARPLPVAAAAGMFLSPPVAAILGAILAGPGQVNQFLGALGGFAAGAVMAAVVAAFARHRSGKTNE